jgi:hypothetical protein
MDYNTKLYATGYLRRPSAYYEAPKLEELAGLIEGGAPQQVPVPPIPDIVIGMELTVDQAWEERVKTASTTEARLHFENSILIDNLGWLKKNNSSSGGEDHLPWTLWGMVLRGGTEKRLVREAKRCGAQIKTRETIGVTKSFQQGKVSPGKQLVWGEQDPKLKWSYVSHGSIGWTESNKKVWCLECPPVLDLSLRIVELKDLRLYKNKLWLLEKCSPGRASQLTKLAPPIQEDITQDLLAKAHLQQTPEGIVREEDLQAVEFMQELLEDLQDFPASVFPKRNNDWRLDLLHQCSRSIARLLKPLIKKWTQEWTVSEISLKTREKMLHRAPFSTRGLLKVQASSPEACLQAWKGTGVAWGLQEKRPRGEGRYIPLHPDYLTRHPPELAKNHHLWHTLSWIQSPGEAIDRLSSILEHGILCTSERERVGIRCRSLDPGGDKLQNVDWGVACGIGEKPGYTQFGEVHLRISPRILMRRDLWFANETLWHFREYLKYNAELGHDKFWSACPPEACLKHLQNLNSSKNPRNEVWVGWMIEPSDIVEIVCEAKFVKPLRKAFDFPVHSIGKYTRSKSPIRVKSAR